MLILFSNELYTLVVLTINACRLILAFSLDVFKQATNKGGNNRTNWEMARTKWQVLMFKIARVHSLLERSVNDETCIRLED